LPVRSGIAWPSDTGEGDGAPWSVAGHVSSSLTTPKSIWLPLLAVLPAAGVWKQTFQSRSRICRRPRPLASWLERPGKPAACASSCAVCSPFPRNRAQSTVLLPQAGTKNLSYEHCSRPGRSSRFGGVSPPATAKAHPVGFIAGQPGPILNGLDHRSRSGRCGRHWWRTIARPAQNLLMTARDEILAALPLFALGRGRRSSHRRT
jgi:hypothetical protein